MTGSLIKYISCSSEQQFVEELKKHGQVVSLKEMDERDSPEQHIVIGTVKHVYKFISNPAGKVIKLILQERCMSEQKNKFFFGFVFHYFATELKKVDLKRGDSIAFRSGCYENTRFEVTPPNIKDLQIVIGFHHINGEKLFLMKRAVVSRIVPQKNVKVGKKVRTTLPLLCYKKSSAESLCTILHSNDPRAVQLNKLIQQMDASLADGAVNKAEEHICVDLTGNEPQREENSGDSDCEIIYMSVQSMNERAEKLQQSMASTSHATASYPLSSSGNQLLGRIKKKVIKTHCTPAENNPAMKRFPLTDDRTQNVEQSAEENNLRTRSGVVRQVQLPPVSDFSDNHPDVEMLSRVRHLDLRCDYVDTVSLCDISLRNITSDEECSVNSLTVNMSSPRPMSVDSFTSSDIEVNNNRVSREENVDSSTKQMGKRQSTEVDSRVSKLRKTDNPSDVEMSSCVRKLIEEENKRETASHSQFSTAISSKQNVECFIRNDNECPQRFVAVTDLDSRCDDVDTVMSDFSGSLSNISLRNITSDEECSVNINITYPPSPMSVDQLQNPRSSDIGVSREENIDSSTKQMGKRQSTEVDSRVSKLIRTDSQRNQPQVLENCMESANKYGNNFQDDPEENNIFFACVFASLESDESALPHRMN